MPTDRPARTPMPVDNLLSPLLITAGALGLLLLAAALFALVHASALKCVVRLLLGAMLLSLGAVCGLVVVGVQGYRALTHEALAARMLIWPTGPQRFTATIQFPDGREM